MKQAGLLTSSRLNVVTVTIIIVITIIIIIVTVTKKLFSIYKVLLLL
jgi:hypothetical protein